MFRPKTVCLLLVLVALFAGAWNWPVRAESPSEEPAACVREVPILFVVRSQYHGDHHNTATMFQTGEINANRFRGGSAVKVFLCENGKKEVKTLLDLPKGVARDIEVSFDGRKILFSMRHDGADDYHIYEMNADGTGLKQLTFAPGVSDIDPIYLPDGRILFASTREPKYCMCNRHIMCNLYVMEGGRCEHPSDRTQHVARRSPGALGGRAGHLRSLGIRRPAILETPKGYGRPTRTERITRFTTATTRTRRARSSTRDRCRERLRSSARFPPAMTGLGGAIALVDRRLGIDLKAPVLQTWPASAIDLIGKGNYDTYRNLKVEYEDPYPLNDREFLCSRMTGKGEQMGIYLLGRDGNESLVHVEGPGCFDPMPLAPRSKPPVVPDRVELAKKDGVFYIADVYVGTGMDNVPRGYRQIDSDRGIA